MIEKNKMIGSTVILMENVISTEICFFEYKKHIDEKSHYFYVLRFPAYRRQAH